tara:strand:+ start:324 stop:1283 length:960 start_codon:yes stop_codon:yes gene_type:complete
LKNILITGATGFIGFHTSKSFLKDNYNIIGIDNMNDDYYDIQIKIDRLNILNKFPNFKFYKIDIENYHYLNFLFKKYKPQKIIHLAAQTGIKNNINPFHYFNSNLNGFINILELCKNNKINGLIYASSSSVYGDSKEKICSTKNNTDYPISIYAATKKSNEILAHSYSHLYNIQTIGLRFFTVYGPWGRPDMSYYIFTNKILKDEPILINNFGKIKRDFTFIDDVVFGIKAAYLSTFKYEIFNLGNNKSYNIMKMINLIEKKLNKKAMINLGPIQVGDVKKTFASINKSIKLLNYKPITDLEIGINNFINWYKTYHKII